ncbi:MAG: hypothetical protein FDZ70_06625 [Actinobacteria bacterium]|nr:MAG: hypothetical protein FDZ70_06625 [Actinomycetota bacterium]
MAIDKSRTAPIIKIGIGFLAIVLAISVGGSIIPGLAAFFGTSKTDTGTRTGGGVLEDAAQRFAGQVAYGEQALASDPASLTVLVALANTYGDWASAIETFTSDPVTPGMYREKAVTYYRKALEIEPGDFNVAVDYAITLYYSGRAAEAASVVDGVLAKDPKFVPALFNGGIFYAEAGRDADAARVLNTYLAADPNGAQGNPDVARNIIAELAKRQSAGPASTASTP